MEFSVEKYISNLVESQFPSFYQEDGPNFILFMKAYYEWMEESGNPIHEARNLFDYRDIDNTLESFLEHFQKKYLYGIPFKVISNKRFLLKHILDVYRSKGTIQCYRLLFRLIYDEDIDIYLPGRDMLRVSDGTWVEPKYLEVSDTEISPTLRGKTIYGVISGTTATVENFIQESYNQDIVDIIFISNILPVGGDFEINEPILVVGQIPNKENIEKAPVVLGSLNSLDITAGGQNFVVGDVVKIVYKDPLTDEISSYGVDGLVKVTSLRSALGTVNFNLISGGFGFMANAETFAYRGVDDITGNGASFAVGSISSQQNITYNTDLICNYSQINIDSTSYTFPGNASANLTSTMGSCFQFANDYFGEVATLSNIKIGNNYTSAGNAFIRSVQTSLPLQGNVVYNSNHVKVFSVSQSGNASGYNNNDVVVVRNNDGGTNAVITFTTNSSGGNLVFTISNPGTAFTTLTPNLSINSSGFGTPSGNSNVSTIAVRFLPYITGDNTVFDVVFANNDAISLRANSSLSSTEERVIIKKVVNSTCVFLYGNPTLNSTPSSTYKAAPAILPSQFAIYESTMSRTDGTINGLNANVTMLPNLGNNTVGTVSILNSGKGYVQGELVKGYLSSGVSEITVVSGGTGYKNNEILTFLGGDPAVSANGYISTDSNGTIISGTLVFAGSDYKIAPEITIETANGSGAELTAKISEYNTNREISGRVVKRGIGYGRGYWSTTRGFLDADKYIQDSYYYQDYSYEIGVARTLDKYREILYNTFHPAGSEMFGKFLLINREAANVQILSESESADTTLFANTYMLASITSLRADSNTVTIDKYII